MQKYGFRDGQGLGKHEQGLSTALSVEKTSKRGGKIIIGDSTEKSEIMHTQTDTQASKPTHHTSKINILIFFFLLIYIVIFKYPVCFQHHVLSFAQPCTHCVSVFFYSFECVCMFQHQDPVRMWLIHMALIQVWLYFISCFPYKSFIFNISLHLYVITHMCPISH